MYTIREMSYGKERNMSRAQVYPLEYEIVGFERVHYSNCIIRAMFESTQPNWIEMKAVSLQNPVTGKWVINAIDSNYNQIVIDVK